MVSLLRENIMEEEVWQRFSFTGSRRDKGGQPSKAHFGDGLLPIPSI